MSVEQESTIKPNFRQAGRQPQGKLLRGFIQDPINKTTSASIPYKFETILYKNTNPRGFGASAQKLIKSEDLGPGPGSYDSDIAFSKTSTSFSKKGYGNGFVSETNRLLYRGYVNTGPGPGAYNPAEQPFKVTHVPHDGKKGAFDTAPKLQPMTSDIPGPGFYDPNIGKTSGVLNSRIVNSIFKSNTGRYRMSANSNPPPGAYEVQGTLVEKKSFKHYLGSSNFMLPTTKKTNPETKNKETANQMLGVEEPTKDVPGPGHYFDAEKDDEIVLFNQKIKQKNSAPFMAGNATRFGEVIKRKVKRFDYPGPGTYLDIFDHSQEKTLVSGAVFMSETARKPFRETKTFIGPMKYNPELLPKKSYHLNINKNWV